MEGRGGDKKRNEKTAHVTVCMCVPRQKVWLLNYLAILYLHGVCFSRGGLSICEYSPIISTQYI